MLPETPRNLSPGDRIRLGREEGEITETTALFARVKLDGGRMVRLDRRLLQPAEPTPTAPQPEASAPEGPASDKAIRGPRERGRRGRR